MSKNIKLNDTTYSGVSTVQLPTTDGGSATFKDIDEITTPSGNLTITKNGTYDVTNIVSAIVNVPTESGESSGYWLPDGSSVIEYTHEEDWTTVDKGNNLAFANKYCNYEDTTDRYLYICLIENTSTDNYAGLYCQVIRCSNTIVSGVSWRRGNGSASTSVFNTSRQFYIGAGSVIKVIKIPVASATGYVG